MGPYTNTPLGGFNFGGGSLNLSMTSPSSGSIFNSGYFRPSTSPYITSRGPTSQRMFGDASIHGNKVWDDARNSRQRRLGSFLPEERDRFVSYKPTIWSDLKDFGGKLGGVGGYEPPVPISGPRLGRINAPRGGRISYRPTDLPQNRYLMGVDDYNARREAALKLWSQLIRRNTYQPLV
jgi:hypothetical protein